MKLIKPYFEIIEQEPGLEGIYKQIELAGRTCYKSEDKITPDSAKGFVDRMIKSGHGAMLEHGTIYLKADSEFINPYIHPEDGEEEEYNDLFKYGDNNYSVCHEQRSVNGNTIYVTTNLRVLVENDWLDDLKYICEPTEYHEKRVTVRFICDRGVSHEFVRHRVFSFAQESTRQETMAA
jgi:thymidylate synthase (FAD)